MNYLIALLLSLTCAQAASSALVGGVRRNFDTTGTNTTTSAVTITGTGGTNLNAGTVQATNSVNVGRAGEQGVVQFTSTNSTYTATISLLANGTLVVTNNGVLVATVALSSGYAGAGTLFLSDDGTYKIGTGGATVNPTDRYYPYRSNSTTFGDGLWYQIQADALGFGSTNWAFVLNATNTLTGQRSYSVTSGALRNTGFGYHALSALTTGDDNTAVGDDALAAVTTTTQTTAVGSAAGRAFTGSNGTFMGHGAGQNMTSGVQPTLIGESAGITATTADNFTAVGSQAGYYNKASDATVLGFQAGVVASNLTRAVIIGSQPRQGSERIDKNFTDTIHIGYKSDQLTNNTQVITNSIYIGPNLLPATVNVIVVGNTNQATLTVGNVIRTPNASSFAAGNNAGAVVASSSLGNTAFGSSALVANVTGFHNTAVGYQALLVENGGYYNVAVGQTALTSATTGDNNVGVGGAALSSVTTGAQNIGIGASSGLANPSGVNLTTGNRNIYIGDLTAASGAAVANEISIGASSIGKGSNTANIGDSTVTVLYLAGGVGWFQGTGSPEGAVTAPAGSFYSNKSGGATNAFWVKETGAGNTGWLNK